MIYAIRTAAAITFYKFGISAHPWKRLIELEVGCPLDLEMAAIANWPNHLEMAIHYHLRATAVRGEWFTDSERAQELIALMAQPDGLAKFLAIVDRRPIAELKARRARVGDDGLPQSNPRPRLKDAPIESLEGKQARRRRQRIEYWKFREQAA